MMGAFPASPSWNRIVIDVCTQRDFLDPGAILQVVNRDTVLAGVERVFEWVEKARLPVVSAVESHRPTELGNGFPMHCIDGTRGQQKLPFTLIEPRTVVENDNYLSLPPNLSTYRQLLFRKRTREILANPKADRFLTQSTAQEFIIMGVGVERAIKSLALGLLARHKPKITVVIDACGYWSAADADLSCRQMSAKGVRMMTVEELTAPQSVPARSGRAASSNGRRRRIPTGSTRTRRSRINVAEK